MYVTFALIVASMKTEIGKDYFKKLQRFTRGGEAAGGED